MGASARLPLRPGTRRAVVGFYPAANPHVPYRPAGIPPAHTGRASRQVIAQSQAFSALAKVIGHEDWLTNPEYSMPDARLNKLDKVFAEIEKWTMTMTKMEVMAKLNPVNVPCGPILSMKESAQEPALRQSGTVVQVDHPERGKYLTVGNPVKLSDSLLDLGWFT